MAQDHPFVQHLQGLLSGTIPMAQSNPMAPMPSASAAPAYTDRAIPMEPGQTLGVGKKPPGGFAGTSPLAPPTATPPSPVNTDVAQAPHPSGMSFGDTMAKLTSGSLPGGMGAGVASPGHDPGPGTFNYMNVLKNAQQAMPQRNDWMSGGLY